MNIPATVAIQSETGLIRQIRVFTKGDKLLSMLKENYNTNKLVTELIENGDTFSIFPNDPTSIFFAATNNLDEGFITQYSNRTSIDDREYQKYNYIFINDRWIEIDINGKECKEFNEVEKTERGFSFNKFKDLYEHECSIQMSSGVEPAIWLGIEDAEPQILASKIIEGGTGWAKYPLPEDVFLNTRMLLNVEQVKTLIKQLEKFVHTGDL